ncbi:MAG: hypothetical protein IIA85_02305 [Nanoarchaeota archaeon]|nr:hypothetical protein [Nanoarchaeota archaeon]
MGEHLIDGEFKSDKYPKTPKGLVPLKPTDTMAQDLLAIYAYRRADKDKVFSEDLLEALRLKGYNPEQVLGRKRYNVLGRNRYNLTYQEMKNAN